MSKIKTYVQMSRLSNLPTVWTNVMVGAAIAGETKLQTIALFCLILSLYYIGGMILNDACDSEWDEKNRPERPIPHGIVSRKQAFFFAGLLLLIANLSIMVMAYGKHQFLWKVILCSSLLTLLIVFYDFFHKNNTFSPVVMGLCRAGVCIVTAQAMTNHLPVVLWLASALLACYVIGLTFIARQETNAKIYYRWPLLIFFIPFVVYPKFWSISIAGYFFTFALLWVIYWTVLIIRNKCGIGQFVGSTIAGIALWDSMVLAHYNITAAMIAVLFFFITLFAHRWVAGT